MDQTLIIVYDYLKLKKHFRAEMDLAKVNAGRTFSRCDLVSRRQQCCFPTEIHFALGSSITLLCSFIEAFYNVIQKSALKISSGRENHSLLIICFKSVF